MGENGWGELRIMPMRCGRWECERCGSWKTREWEDRIEPAVKYWVDRGGRARLLTFTLVRDVDDGRAAFREATRVMRRFQGRMRSRGFEWRYVGCVDVGRKTGRPHLHLIEVGERYLPQKLLSAQWAASGGGEIVDVRAVRSVKGAVRELCKYLMKGRFVRLDGIHRVRSSQDFFEVEDADRDDDDGEDVLGWVWRYSSASMKDWVRMWAGAVASGRMVMSRVAGGLLFRVDWSNA